jgi:hypothetical protein
MQTAAHILSLQCTQQSLGNVGSESCPSSHILFLLSPPWKPDLILPVHGHSKGNLCSNLDLNVLYAFCVQQSNLVWTCILAVHHNLLRPPHSIVCQVSVVWYQPGFWRQSTPCLSRASWFTRPMRAICPGPCKVLKWVFSASHCSLSQQQREQA